MKKMIWCLLIPALVLVSINSFIPTMAVFNYSFQEVVPGLPTHSVGMENYFGALHSPVFLAALGRSLLFSVIVIAIELSLGLVVALTLPESRLFRTVALTIFGVSLVIPWASIGFNWRLMSRAGGIIPEFLSSFGIYFSISNPTHVFGLVILADIWQWTPLAILIFVAGLSAIPKRAIYSAKIDGASSLQTFRRVILPGIKWPLLIFVLIRFVDSFRIFDVPYILAGSGPNNSLNFLSTYVYKISLFDFHLGVGAAISLIFFFIVIFVSFIIFKLLAGKREGGQR